MIHNEEILGTRRCYNFTTCEGCPLFAKKCGDCGTTLRYPLFEQSRELICLKKISLDEYVMQYYLELLTPDEISGMVDDEGEFIVKED